MGTPTGCAATTAPRRPPRRPRLPPAASRADHHEPAPVVEDVAAADLLRQALAAEPALVDAVTRAVVEAALLPLLARLARRVDDHQLAADAARLGQEALALLAQQVAVEVAGQHAVEGAVGEGHSQRVADDGHPVGQAALGQRHHRRALVEPDDEPAEVATEKARAARDVERAGGLEAGQQPLDRGDLLGPARPLARGEEAAPEPPVVVLGRPRLVVGAVRLVHQWFRSWVARIAAGATPTPCRPGPRTRPRRPACPRRRARRSPWSRSARRRESPRPMSARRACAPWSRPAAAPGSAPC